MKIKSMFAGLAAGTMLMSGIASAATISFVSGATGNDLAIFQEQVKPWEEKTGNKVTVVPMPSSTSDQFGQYRLWLAAGNSDIDLYQMDVIWAPQLADQFVDLTEAAKDIAPLHFPSIIESQTVNGKLVAMPLFTDAPALYFRKDLLEKYGKTAPKTWDEMAATAEEIQNKEREADNKGCLDYYDTLKACEATVDLRHIPAQWAGVFVENLPDRLRALGPH